MWLCGCCFLFSKLFSKMPTCCAFGCNNSSCKDRKDGITFHRFPQKTELRKLWILAVKRKNWLPSHTSVLCSKHFSENQIDRYSAFRVRIKENEVPQIFPAFPSHMQKKIKPKRSAKKRIIPVVSTTSVPEEPPSDNLIARRNSSINTSEIADISNSQQLLHTNLSSTSENSAFKVRIKENEVPEIFPDFPSNMQKKIKPRRSPKTRIIPVVSTTSVPEEPPSDNLIAHRHSIINTSEIADISNSQQLLHTKLSPASENSLKHKLEEAEKKIAIYKKKIRLLQQENWRMKKTISDLSILMENLQ